MRKGYSLILLLLVIILPVKVFAMEAMVDMTCANTGLPDTGSVSCTISASTSDIVTGFHGVLSFSNDVNITNFTLDSSFTSFDGNITTSTSPVEIDIAVIAGENIPDLEGDFTIATFDISIKEESTSSTQQVSLSEMKFYDENVNAVNISGMEIVTFSDYLSLGSYQHNDTLNLIYGLSCPMTVGSLLNGISSNAVVGILNSSNTVLVASDNLATGYKLSTTYRDGTPIEYIISMRGDVMGEGAITLNGAKKISRHIVDQNVITGDAYLMAADYDQNNVIKMNDVVKMLKEMED